MKKDELLKTLYDFIREKIISIETDGQKWDMNIGVCYTVGKVAYKILKRCGYNVSLIKVMVVSGDKKGRELMKANPKISKEELIKKGGWVVGIGVYEKDVRKDNHWVIWFEDEGMVMDLTYEQASRPEHNMICKAYFEKEDELPETVFKIIRVPSDVQSYLYMNEEPLKTYFKNVIKDGVKLLKKKRLNK